MARKSFALTAGPVKQRLRAWETIRPRAMLAD
jgi:hypothetical protein